MNVNTRKLTTMAMMTALSIVLVWLIHLPIIPSASFLEYDPADIPILISTLTMGPLAGLTITVLACLIQGFTVSASSGLYGILMHVIATGTYVLVAGNLFKRTGRNRGSAAISLFVGAVCWVAVMIVANLIITPLFLGTSVEVVKGMILPAILPFNLIKVGINGAVAFVVYKQVGKLMLGDQMLSVQERR